VIKIETRKRPDEQRIQHGAGASPGYESSSNFFEINLNKLSVSLDLSTPKGSELARRIVSISDVVMENMRPGVMDKLGLGYKDFIKVRSDIIMLSLSGYGATGPYRGYTAYAPCFSCFGGQAHLTGYVDAEPNTLTSSCDSRAGTAGAFAVLMALNLRQQTGKGQYIDLSSSELLNAMIGDQMMDYSMNRRSPSRTGNHDAVMAPHNCYRCKGNDRWISIAVASDEEWGGLCRAMEDPEWTKDPAFSTAYGRWHRQDRLDPLIQEWTIRFGHYELMKKLQSHGVAAMPSFKAKDLFSDPHIVARGGVTEIEHPVLGMRKTIAPPWMMSETPPAVVRTAPLLGEHNEYVLRDLLGISQADLDQLVEEKIVY
jgi:crotonobetainyl-CoA:carnitine CoA-transferase CaiB-like acyl-CoA transferase